MAKRATTIGIIAGIGALVSLVYAAKAAASTYEYDDSYLPNEEKGAGLFEYDTGATMNYKVNEYPKYASAIASAEARYGLPVDLLARLLYQESRYRADIIAGTQRSPVGATGIAQFMPRTGQEYGLVDYDASNQTIVADRRLDPFASIDSAGRYLKALYRIFNDWRSALMAYNWGPGNVMKYNRGEYVSVPIETSNYVAQITADVNVA